MIFINFILGCSLEPPYRASGQGTAVTLVNTLELKAFVEPEVTNRPKVTLVAMEIKLVCTVTQLTPLLEVCAEILFPLRTKPSQ